VSDHSRSRGGDQQALALARRPAPSAREECACFADEVAVDFPSIADAIERLRRAFLDGEGENQPLCAELRLSPREAFDGVTVPLDVPVRRTCAECGGRGESWLEPCAGCAGTGAWQRPHRVHVSVPPGVADGARFRFTITAPCTASTLVDVRVAIR
jgi:hypothetical protein